MPAEKCRKAVPGLRRRRARHKARGRSVDVLPEPNGALPGSLGEGARRARRLQGRRRATLRGRSTPGRPARGVLTGAQDQSVCHLLLALHPSFLSPVAGCPFSELPKHLHTRPNPNSLHRPLHAFATCFLLLPHPPGADSTNPRRALEITLRCRRIGWLEPAPWPSLPVDRFAPR